MTCVLHVGYGKDSISRSFRDLRRRTVLSPTQTSGNHLVLECLDDKATQGSVCSTFESYTIDVVLAGGHGTPEAFEGADGQPIWHSASSLDEAPNATFHLLCCSAAQQLGKALVSRGALGVWAYDDLFLIPTPSNAEDPSSDPWVESILQMAMLVDTGLLQGDGFEAIARRVEAHVAMLNDQLPELPYKLLLNNHGALCYIESGSVRRSDSFDVDEHAP